MSATMDAAVAASGLAAADWLAIFTHFLSLSLLAIGGAITTAPDMHRYLVTQHGWLSESQFSAAIALVPLWVWPLIAAGVMLLPTVYILARNIRFDFQWAMLGPALAFSIGGVAQRRAGAAFCIPAHQPCGVLASGGRATWTFLPTQPGYQPVRGFTRPLG